MLEQECAAGLSFDRVAGTCNLMLATKCELDLCPANTVGTIAMVPNPYDCSKLFYYLWQNTKKNWK